MAGEMRGPKARRRFVTVLQIWVLRVRRMMQEGRAELRPRFTEGKTQLEQGSGVKSGRITPATGVVRGWNPPEAQDLMGGIVGNQAVWIPRRGLVAAGHWYHV